MIYIFLDWNVYENQKQARLQSDVENNFRRGQEGEIKRAVDTFNVPFRLAELGELRRCLVLLMKLVDTTTVKVN